jgi:DNA-binding MarR family transcriptional regulator
MEGVMEETAVRMLIRCARHLNHGKGRRPAQERILYLLRKHQTMTPKELQEQMETAQGSVSEILSKLEAQDFIVKQKNPDDARSIILSLSEKGKKTAEENHRLWRENEEKLLDALNDEEKETLKEICMKLLQSWEDNHA